MYRCSARVIHDDRIRSSMTYRQIVNRVMTLISVVFIVFVRWIRRDIYKSILQRSAFFFIGWKRKQLCLGDERSRSARFDLTEHRMHDFCSTSICILTDTKAAVFLLFSLGSRWNVTRRFVAYAECGFSKHSCRVITKVIIFRSSHPRALLRFFLCLKYRPDMPMLLLLLMMCNHRCFHRPSDDF